MLLNSICELDVACCSPRTTVLEAAHIMRQKHIGDLVVVDDDEERRHPIGVITDRDIVIEILGKDLDPAQTVVGCLVRTPVVIAQDDEDTSDVLERMRKHGVRRIPVVSAATGRLVGIITVDDLLKRLACDANLLTEIVSREQSFEQRTRR